MAEKKLPNGVGKKIVQALKKQAEIEIQPVSDTIDQSSLIKETPTTASELYESAISDNTFQEENFSDFSSHNFLNEESEDFTNSNEETPLEDFTKSFEDAFSTEINFEEPQTPAFEKEDIFKNPGVSSPQQKAYSMPANVAVLKRLILQLPQGVSKQTGAQIIRQTMEALGISMNSVLKEAQQGQDSLTSSAKSCISTIQEYQNAIKNLEKQVEDYKKQAVALNDLISLFVMTDKR